MRPKGRSRRFGVVAVSVAFHAAVLTALALHGPRLKIPVETAGPPVPIIPVLILPRAPPPAGVAGAAPTPIRLHRRPQRFAPADLPIAPLIVPEAPAAPPAPTDPGPRTVQAPTREAVVATNAVRALRSRLGCANANALGLTRAEREACDDQLAAGARQADYLGTGMNADKAAGLAAAAARNEGDYKFKRMTPQAAPGGRIGSTARDLGESLGDDRPAATVPF
jgi:hypothetical protein